MSVLGGKAAGMAAVSGAGSSLRDRFPSAEQQQERVAQLRAQRDYYLRKKMPGAMAEVDVLIADVLALGGVPCAPPAAAARKRGKGA